MANVYESRIESLRALMRSRGWDAVVICGSDPHGSEFLAERWKQVLWLTGFTGEAGDVVVTPDHAGLWTDSRYFIQAGTQLAGTGVSLHKTRVPDQVLIPDWLAGEFPDGAVIAVDGLCTSKTTVDSIEAAFAGAGDDSQCGVVAVPDLLDALWRDRPSIPSTPVFTIDPGESRLSKIEWLRSGYSASGCDGILVCALDEIAWLLNVRAADIEYNPFVFSYLLVDDSEVRWFVTKDSDLDPGTAAAFAELEDDGISILPYDEAERALLEFDGLVQADPSALNAQMYNAIAGKVRLCNCPVAARKARKNSFEIEGMRRVHVCDGLAMEKFLYWLEKSLAAGRRVTEWDASVKLGQLRGAIDGYVSDSFETISACGAGAALPHYSTPHTDAPELPDEGLYLCDAGAQYFRLEGCYSGTTDLTRTIPLGPVTPLEAEDYTLVLKGCIDLAMAVFPEGTPGCRLDAIAREPLWRAHRNFGHGTGHGVGSFLGCHEGPQDVRQNMNDTPLQPGMVISDEPGIYREGQHGIRHENLLLCVEAGENQFGRWLAFEPLTLCHIDTSIIRRDLMDSAEIEWLNSYNSRVYETLAPLLPEEMQEWLGQKTAAI